MKLVSYQRPGMVFGSLLNHELNRLIEASQQSWSPVLDVQEDKDKFTVNLELPGLKREDINVHLEDGNLIVSGERKSEPVGEETEIHRQERCYGKFSRTLALPVAVSVNQVKASFKDGILTVTLPKAEEAKPKQIDVTVN